MKAIVAVRRTRSGSFSMNRAHVFHVDFCATLGGTEGEKFDVAPVIYSEALAAVDSLSHGVRARDLMVFADE